MNTTLDKMDKPQILVHAHLPLDYTPYSVRWLPTTPSLTVVGQSPSATGKIQTYTLNASTLVLKSSLDRTNAIKCCEYVGDKLAYGDFKGNVGLIDKEVDVWSVKGHDEIVNCIDTAPGPVEIVTGSRDGCVKVWDVRVKDAVAVIIPKDGTRQDTWAVAFGNSWNEGERVVSAGYENGDVKLFDLKAMKLLWETNVGNGVCAMEFDRKDIKMNKLCVGGLEGTFNTYDMRTRHPTTGYASVGHSVCDMVVISRRSRTTRRYGSQSIYRRTGIYL
jgi:WD40 repeat protein